MESQDELSPDGGTDLGPIAYGCWRFAENSVEQGHRLIAAALDHGMTLIDTADIYGFGTEAGFGGAEALLGQIFARDPGLRNRMVLASKGGITPPTPYNSSYQYLVEACDASLARMGVDTIDLYQIHRPDLLASFEEMAEALERLRDDGKIIDIGVSNFTTGQFRALQAHLETDIASHQPEFSAWRQDPITDGTLDQCQEFDALCLAWSPLAGGALAMGSGIDDPRFSDVMGVIDRLAEAHGATRTQIALAFCLRHPANVIPIIGTQTEDRIAEAAKANAVELSRRDWYDLVEARRGVPMP